MRLFHSIVKRQLTGFQKCINVILVTGGTGFIGSLLIKDLLGQGKSVLATKRKDSIIPQKLQYKSNLFWFDADITDYFALKDIFTNVTQVYHCAGMVSFDPSDSKELMKVNVEGTTHIVNLSLEAKARLLFVSSVAALGEKNENEYISEDSKWEWSPTVSSYSISKFEAEREVWRGMAEGLDAVIVNPTIVIGAEENSKTNEMFSLLEKGLKYYPTGSSGFVDVQDLVSIMTILMETKDIKRTSFLINNVNLSYQELFQRYAALINKDAPSLSAKPWLLNLATLTEKLMSLVGLRGKPKLTKDIIRSSIKKSVYSNEKITKTINYIFKPIDLSLEEISRKTQ